MDVLSDVLRVVRMSGAVFFTAEFSSPWALESPNPDLLASVVIPKAECIVLFHILTSGECTVGCEGLPKVKMQAGDVIIFPHGDPHVMCSPNGAKPTPINSVFFPGSPDEIPKVSFGGGGEKSHFICGYLNCDQRFNLLIGALPTMLLVRSRDDYRAVEAVDHGGVRPARVPQSSSSWLSTTLKFTVNEAKTARPGNAAMLGRLAELMFVEILRQYMQQLPTGQGEWLAGLNDAHVGKALRLMHAHPEWNWTVSQLAHEAGVSRSALAERFAQLVGQSPMRYLVGWRIQLAKQMLRDASSSIAEVATQVGYDSDAAFNRAFKRLEGSPPAAWRKGAIGAVICTLAFLMNLQPWLEMASAVS
jgi:AraC-like DNA-binding protein